MIIVQHYLYLHAEGLARIAQAHQISNWNGRAVAYITGYLLCVPLIGSIVWFAMRFFASFEQPIPVQISPPPPSESPLSISVEASVSPPLPTHVPTLKTALDDISEHSNEDASSESSTDYDSPTEEATTKAEVEEVVEEKETPSSHNASPISGDPLSVITQNLDVVAEPLKKTPRPKDEVEVALRPPHARPIITRPPLQRPKPDRPVTLRPIHDRPGPDSTEPLRKTPQLNDKAEAALPPPQNLPKEDLPAEPLQKPQHVNGVAAIPVPPPAPTQVLSYIEITQGISFPFTIEIQKTENGFVVTKRSANETRISHYDLAWNILELSEKSSREWWNCKRTNTGVAFEGLKQKKAIKDVKACKRWLQEFHVAFQPFVKSKDKELHFSILSEKDWSFTDLFAKKIGLEKINGKDALRLEIRLDNWALKHLWSGLVWLDPKTGFMVRKRMKDGLTAPVTITDLTKVL